MFIGILLIIIDLSKLITPTDNIILSQSSHSLHSSHSPQPSIWIKGINDMISREKEDINKYHISQM